MTVPISVQTNRLRILSNILVHPNSKIMYGNTVVNNASKVVAHMVGVDFTVKETRELLLAIYGHSNGKHLPKPVK